MKILLLYPTWTGAYGLFGHFARRNSTWPPLNLALLAAIAERHGHEATILDGEAEHISLDDMVRQAVEQKPDLIGFTCTSPFFHLSKAVAEGHQTAGAPDSHCGRRTPYHHHEGAGPAGAV